MGMNGAGPIREKIKEIVPEYSYQPNGQPGDSAARIAPAVLEQSAGRA